MAIKLGNNQTVSLRAVMHKAWLETEMRVHLIDEKRALEYKTLMDQGVKFPQPVLFFDTHQELYWTGDGFHRLKAHALRGTKTVEVEVRKGDYTAAMLYNIESNKGHLGLPFSQGDRKKAILAIATNPATKNWSQTQIAEHVGTNAGYVSKVLKDNEVARPAKVEGMDGVFRNSTRKGIDTETKEARMKVVKVLLDNKVSEREIAKTLNVNKSTVAGYKKELFPEGKIKCPCCHGAGTVTRDVANEYRGKQ